MVLLSRKTQWALAQYKKENSNGVYEIFDATSGRKIALVGNAQDAALLMYAPELREAAEITISTLRKPIDQSISRERLQEIVACLDSLLVLVEGASQKIITR